MPIVRTVKGLPDYRGLFGPLPLLDAASLDEAFEARLRAVLTQREIWESYLPAHTPHLVPDAGTIAALTVRNPHCQLIDLVARFRDEPTRATLPEVKPIRCETWYKLYTPHGMQKLPRWGNTTLVGESGGRR